MKKGFLEGYKTYDPNNGFGNPKKWRKALYEKMSREDAGAILEKQAATPYALLGIDATASTEEIKKAFRKCILLWHPDKNPDNQAMAEEMSKKIIAAYTFLAG